MIRTPSKKKFTRKKPGNFKGFPADPDPGRCLRRCGLGEKINKRGSFQGKAPIRVIRTPSFL
jgi:hypothetical protein